MLVSSRRIQTRCALVAAASIVLTFVAVGHVAASTVPVNVTWAAAVAGSPSIALGADVKHSGSETEQQAITAFETSTGHQLAYTRDYLLWNSPFPTSYEQWLGARGTLPLISVKPQTLGGTVISWASIAAAVPGSALYSQMKKWADEIKAFGYPVYFTFNHEPEAAASDNFGTAADYVAAWRNFHNVFVAEGATNAKFMWIMTSFAFLVPTTDPRYAWNWYPGDAYVDAIGADAYTAYTCDNPTGIWRSLQYELSGFVKFGTQHPTMPMWLPEFGVVENPSTSGAKAQWLADAQALFKTAAYHQFVGIAYFNESRPGTACNWQVSSSASAQAAFDSMAQDPFFQGSASLSGPPPAASFTSTCTGLSCAFNGNASTGQGSLTYAWTFGDEGTSTTGAPSHGYAAAGLYPVTLTVKDSTGAVASSTQHLTVAAPAIAFVGAASTTANSSVETVRVPAPVTAGDGLVLIATDASVDALSAPAGWAPVATISSATMSGEIWERVAAATDAATSVSVKFGGVDKGSVELLAYSGTSSVGPVLAANGATSDVTTPSVETPSLMTTEPGQLLLSYWAARTSADTTLALPTNVTLRSTETGSGGGRVTSASADSGTSTVGSLLASVTPAAGHSVAWSLLLSPAT
jgi:PKD repeat protein